MKSIQELDRYPWSGHAFLIGRRKNGWQEMGYMLGQFSGERRRAIRAYRRFVAEGKDHGRRDDLVERGWVGVWEVGHRLSQCEGEDREKSPMNEFLGMETLYRPSYGRQNSGSFGSSGFAEVVGR